ncbi:MAG: hypothetical protein NTU53_20130 [Planctomycetota bacterium]|nr:hypothetical protein [Planctomycetota bacterium]
MAAYEAHLVLNGHLNHVSWRRHCHRRRPVLDRRLVWDGQNQRVIGDDQANRLLRRPQRYPYVL